MIRSRLGAVGMTNDEYAAIFKKIGKSVNNDMWRMVVEYVWIGAFFVYQKKRRRNLFANGFFGDTAYAYFTRHIINVPNIVFSKSKFFFELASYLGEIYPNLLLESPLENPKRYKFPYPHLTVDHLLLVYQIPERLDLLHLAEKRRMNYGQFFDFVVNHVSSINEAAGESVFVMRNRDPKDKHAAFPAVKYRDYKPAIRVHVPPGFNDSTHA